MAQLNALRAQHGLPANVVEVPELSAACAAHVSYMNATGTFSHSEDPARAEYTEIGNRAAGTSVLSRGWNATGPEPWLEAPYHLLQVLSPYLAVTGFSSSHGYACLVTIPRGFDAALPSYNPVPGIYSYPGDGTVDQPNDVYMCHEQPRNPATVAGLDCSSTGTPLYLWRTPTTDDAGTPSPTRVPASVTLVADSGEAVPVRIVAGSTSAIAIPERPLLVATWYTAEANYGDVTRRWRFRTIGLDPLLEVGPYAANQYMHRDGTFVVRGFSATGMSPSDLTVTATLPATGRSLGATPATTPTTGSWKARMPVNEAGRWRLCVSTSGGADSRWMPQTACATVWIREDLVAPRLTLWDTSERRTASQRIFRLYGSVRDAETFIGTNHRCEYRYGTQPFRPCLPWADEYWHYRRVVIPRNARYLRMRFTDPQGNSRVVLIAR